MDYRFSRLFTGIRRPRRTIFGSEFAGKVEEVGPAVTELRFGDEVFGIAGVSRPATLTAHLGFSGDRELAEVAFDRWREALALRTTILRTFLRGQDVFREWIDEGFEKEVEERWSGKDEEEIRRLIEWSRAASAERERQLRSWWRDWGEAARYPWRTRALVAGSFAFLASSSVFRSRAWTPGGLICSRQSSVRCSDSRSPSTASASRPARRLHPRMRSGDDRARERSGCDTE